jgi:DNA modification methylase
MALLSSNKEYYIHHGDCIPHMIESMECNSVDMSIYSPPFPSVFSYTSLSEDLGNSEDLDHEGRLHFSFFFRAMLPVLKPGRVMMVHCTQIVRLKRSGEEGLYDFRGLLIRLAQRAGWTYEYDWLTRRNPQAQAIRTRNWELKFQGLEADRAIVRGVLGDYLIKFRKPGQNQVPVDSKGEVSRNDWIEWAEDRWDIKETYTLNTKEARSDSDARHICPLQLDIINHLVRLYTNPREIVFSPFSGIGSEGYEALKLNRRFYGIEIKPEYHATAIKNCERAIKKRQEAQSLFAMMREDDAGENGDGGEDGANPMAADSSPWVADDF